MFSGLAKPLATRSCLKPAHSLPEANGAACFGGVVVTAEAGTKRWAVWQNKRIEGGLETCYSNSRMMHQMQQPSHIKPARLG